MGMVKSGWRLASELLPPNLPFVLVAFDDGPANDWYLFYPNPDYDPTSWFVYTTGNGPGHYPYGWPVKPD